MHLKKRFFKIDFKLRLYDEIVSFHQDNLLVIDYARMFGKLTIKCELLNAST